MSPEAKRLAVYVAGRGLLLLGAIALGGYSFGTPGSQALASTLCGACIGAYVGTGVFR